MSSENDLVEDYKKKALAGGARRVQRAVWNLAWEGATKIKNGKIDTGDPAAGPRAVPGTYTVKLTVDGQTLTTPLTILATRRTRRPRPTSTRNSRSACACATTSRG